jgi:hypothetical protein
MDLVSAFRELIHDDYRLPQAAGQWVIQETGALTQNPEVHIAAGAALGFTLDRGGKNPLAFIKENTALVGMRSFCDAVLVCNTESVPVVLLLEMKSKNAGKARQQILRSKKLVEWLLGLLILNDHCRETPRFMAVISKGTRNQERKGTSVRRAQLPAPDDIDGMPCWTVMNRRVLHVVDLLKACR